MTELTEEIIVGSDESPGSELALHWAARDASDRTSTLTVCHAWAPVDLALLIEPPLSHLARRQGEEIVQRACGTPGRSRGPAGRSRCWPLGPPAQVLCEHSGAATMLIVGSRGHGRLRRYLSVLPQRTYRHPDVVEPGRGQETSPRCAVTLSPHRG